MTSRGLKPPWGGMPQRLAGNLHGMILKVACLCFYSQYNYCAGSAGVGSACDFNSGEQRGRYGGVTLPGMDNNPDVRQPVRFKSHATRADGRMRLPGILSEMFRAWPVTVSAINPREAKGRGE